MLCICIRTLMYARACIVHDRNVHKPILYCALGENRCIRDRRHGPFDTGGGPGAYNNHESARKQEHYIMIQ